MLAGLCPANLLENTEHCTEEAPAMLSEFYIWQLSCSYTAVRQDRPNEAKKVGPFSPFVQILWGGEGASN